MTPVTVAAASFSLAIIAGGKSRRMGRDKAFIEVGGKTLVERVIAASADLGQAETMLIANQPDDYRRFGLPIHRDILPNKGPLGGIYTALTKAKSDWVLALACDMPFVNRDLLRHMIEQTDDAADIVVPRVDGYPQGLHALYRRTCLKPIERQLEADRLKIIRFYEQMRVRYLDESDYAAIDPDGCCFTNLNSPAQLAEAERLLNAQA